MRTLLPGQLLLGLGLAPMIAGAIGGTLISFGLPLQVMTDFTVLEALRTGLVMSFFALLIAVFVCYTAGLPVILAAWAIAHFARLRAPWQMGLVMAAGGTLFAFMYLLNGELISGDIEQGRDPAMLVALPAGFVAGFVAGLVIGLLGYAAAAPEETVSPREA